MLEDCSGEMGVKCISSNVCRKMILALRYVDSDIFMMTLWPQTHFNA